MNLKFRLSLMNFLEFAVWGAYLTCMGNYLGTAGLGEQISWFYALQGIVSIFMPTLMGIVADKYIQPQRLLGICHLIAGAAMLCCWYMGLSAGFGNELPNKGLFIGMYTLSVAFYMPTLALSNTTAFTILKNNGLDTVKDFPPIRVLGTVGFIVTMWFVNCAVWDDGSFGFTLGENAHKFQYTYMQFFVSGVLSLVLFLYTLTLPECKLEKKPAQSLAESLGLNAFKLFKTKKMALFFIFCMFLGVSLQITNGFATPFLGSFAAAPEFAETFAVQHSTMLVSISQICEAVCILLIPFFLKRFGIKNVMLMAMFAWVLRFALFGAGNPAMPGVLLFVLSCVVYGFAFDFFNISGALYVDQETDPSMRSSAQGLFMVMTNGVGATIGTLGAQAVVNKNVYALGQAAEFAQVWDGWKMSWYTFAAYALIVAIAFWIIFPKTPVKHK